MPYLLSMLVSLLLAAPVAAQSSWPADRVDFDDATDLEAKVTDGSIGANAPHVSTSEVSAQTIASELQKGSDVFWNAGNDGSGSGLDADTLDGLEASAFYSGATPLAASAYAGPAELWLGRVKLKSDGADPTSSYLQSTEVAHIGAATQVDFTNTQDDANVVLTGASGGSVFVFTLGAWERSTSGRCKMTLYQDDTYVIGSEVSTWRAAPGHQPGPGGMTASLAVAESATTNVAIWTNGCTGTTDSAWDNFYRIERF